MSVNPFDEIAQKNCPRKSTGPHECEFCRASFRLAQAAVEATYEHLKEHEHYLTQVGLSLRPDCQSDILRRTQEILCK